MSRKQYVGHARQPFGLASRLHALLGKSLVLVRIFISYVILNNKVQLLIEKSGTKKKRIVLGRSHIN